MFDLPAVRAALKQMGLDGWLLYDFRNSNVLARRVLAMEDQPVGSRRFAYFIPASGEPRKLVHRIESGALDHLPGEKRVYLRWQEFEEGIRFLLGGAKKVALEYSPRNAIPYMARIDAGTVELVRSFGAEAICSGDLIQTFEAMWDEEQWQLHLQAAKYCADAYPKAFAYIADRVRSLGSVTEREVQQYIMKHFEENHLTTYHPPIVGVGPHSGDPHYETGDAPMKEGDFVLIDLWAKMDRPRAVYADYTWVGFIGKEVPAQYEKIFQIVRQARDAGIHCVKEAYAKNRPLRGWEVDEATRAVIVQAGYGEAFCHRTGHSIGQETHGNGANMDNLETHDERLVLRRTCFSIEPGIYLPEFGVRSETNLFIDGDGGVHVTGPDLQTTVVPILAQY
jgi:Xaa-Pro aminopeptidase